MRRTIRRILVCSGKVYVDLVSAEQRASRPDVAICRLEQLYPVPMRDLRAALDAYPNAEEVVWVQEEPENMGAWEFIRPHLHGSVVRPDGAPHRPAAQRQPRRGIRRAARAQPAGARRTGVRNGCQSSVVGDQSAVAGCESVASSASEH